MPTGEAMPGEHEAEAIFEARGIQRHFRAMGVAVEDSEQSDDPHRHRYWNLDAEGDDRAEHDDRKRDAGSMHGTGIPGMPRKRQQP